MGNIIHKLHSKKVVVMQVRILGKEDSELLHLSTYLSLIVQFDSSGISKVMCQRVPRGKLANRRLEVLAVLGHPEHGVDLALIILNKRF